MTIEISGQVAHLVESNVIGQEVYCSSLPEPCIANATVSVVDFSFQEVERKISLSEEQPTICAELNVKLPEALQVSTIRTDLDSRLSEAISMQGKADFEARSTQPEENKALQFFSLSSICNSISQTLHAANEFFKEHDPFPLLPGAEAAAGMVMRAGLNIARALRPAAVAVRNLGPPVAAGGVVAAARHAHPPAQHVQAPVALKVPPSARPIHTPTAQYRINAPISMPAAKSLHKPAPQGPSLPAQPRASLHARQAHAAATTLHSAYAAVSPAPAHSHSPAPQIDDAASNSVQINWLAAKDHLGRLSDGVLYATDDEIISADRLHTVDTLRQIDAKISGCSKRVDELTKLNRAVIVIFIAQAQHFVSGVSVESAFSTAAKLLLQVLKSGAGQDKEIPETDPSFWRTVKELLGAMYEELGRELRTETYNANNDDEAPADIAAGTSGFDPDEDPNDKEPEEHKVEFLKNEAQIKHIFRNDPEGGHVPDTLANRKTILDTANNEKNFLRFDKHGNKWYQRVLKDGRQAWVRVRDGKVTDARINDPPVDILAKLSKLFS